MLMPTGLMITAVIVVVLVFMTLKVVPEYQRLVVLRLGKVLERPKGPGIVILIPLVDKAVRVDLREKYNEIPHQTCITKDNASISVDFLIYSKVVDPIASFVQVQDFDAAAEGIAVTTLRAVVGDIALDDVLAKREEINHVLQTKMDQVTTRWGVKITTVEIREITPPKDILDAMGRQMSAERSRRATVTEAEGTKAAAITVADGEKQAVILKAEGDRQARILNAEGERQAAILRAEGFSLALSKIFEVAKGVDAKTMSLQYLDALRTLGASPSTKFVLPLELTSLLSGVMGDSRKAFTSE
ncbi:MAG: SPFH/Band 7/PHB domain protein [Nitrospirae bacterium]|nr:MAG: SPFH/Band 7/PHB domain protein [Nitrospirota bacterium]